MKTKTQQKTNRPAEAETGRKKAGTEKKPVTNTARFPVIGIGASAGGLEAFELFFKSVPGNSGMAFVLVPHLDPGHASMLTEILQRVTPIPVAEATNQMIVEPDHVYIIPPNRDMALFHGALQLSIPVAQRGLRLPIDGFLRSLSEEMGEKTIAVILSGSGTDGTLGLRAVLGGGGVSFVQDPATARYDGMPLSAIQNELATYVLPADRIYGEIAAYMKSYGIRNIPPPVSAIEGKNPFMKILMILRTKTGHDFSQYKQNTIRRRIERRMVVHTIDKVEEYARFLQENPAEIRLLFKELLINVTSFFRDPEAFETLKTEILPSLFEQKPEDYVFRVWVAGGASGEEAYSIAMIFKECMSTARHPFRVQIYSTDIDDDSIATARGGVYPLNIAIDVSPERLRRFFIKEENSYRINKDIREMVVFAVQDVIKDPPFTRLDLLSCRNLLIYFEPELQNKLIPAFHYALNPGGILFLSPSESIGRFTELFAALSRKWKFYTSRQYLTPARVPGTYKLPAAASSPLQSLSVTDPAKETSFAEITKGILLESYAPPTVIINEDGDTLYVHGDTGKYLRPAQGQANMNLLQMAREGLPIELRKGINTAIQKKAHVVIPALPVRTNGGMHPVDITIRPFNHPATGKELLIVSFEDADRKTGVNPPARTRKRGEIIPGREEELKQELAYTRDNLQATIVEMQATNEELKSTNEELQSTNEELQSTNEELETSKEELQSVNEEIVTVNAELQAKIEQLTDVQNDMKNLLDSISIGTIFLDQNLAVKRFTRDAVRLFRLIASDAGRPLADIKSNMISGDILADAQEVIDTMIPREKEVQTSENLWFLARITPYRTFENVIDGAVLTFTDITKIKTAEAEARDTRELAENVIDTIREPLLVLDPDYKIVSASRSFYSAFQTKPGETIGRILYDLGNRQWNIPRLRELLETVLPENTSFEDVEVDHTFPGIGRRKMLLNGRRIQSETGEPRFILLAMEDITSAAPRRSKTKAKGTGK